VGLWVPSSLRKGTSYFLKTRQVDQTRPDEPEGTVVDFVSEALGPGPAVYPECLSSGSRTGSCWNAISGHRFGVILFGSTKEGDESIGLNSSFILRSTGKEPISRGGHLERVLINSVAETRSKKDAKKQTKRFVRVSFEFRL
jgi:hypothetical protein